MGELIKPMGPPSEIVQMVRVVAHEMENICEYHGIRIRRIRAVREFPEMKSSGQNLTDILMDMLFRAFTEYDKFRTQQIEDLKKQVTELVMRMPPSRIVVEKDGKL